MIKKKKNFQKIQLLINYSFIFINKYNLYVIFIYLIHTHMFKITTAIDFILNYKSFLYEVFSYACEKKNCLSECFIFSIVSISLKENNEWAKYFQSNLPPTYMRVLSVEVAYPWVNGISFADYLLLLSFKCTPLVVSKGNTLEKMVLSNIRITNSFFPVAYTLMYKYMNALTNIAINCITFKGVHMLFLW